MSNETKENFFNREQFLKKTKEYKGVWDVVVIGGGATGLGVALDASSRGYSTLLLEQADFSGGTSSRSTKLAHGGVRYLAQGNIGLVNEALYERGLMLKNAPHLVKMLPFVIPGYRWWEKYFYGIGLKIYDWMARKLRMGKTVLLSAGEVGDLMPNLRRKGLNGGVLYFDGQFDDSRLAINIAQTCAKEGGVLLNYMKVNSLQKTEDGIVCGVNAEDLISGKKFSIKSKTVINATGVFVDDILTMNGTNKNPMIKASQGVHIVLKKSFLDGDHALMIPSTTDGRVLFAVPWNDHLVVGTTDTPVNTPSLNPVALESEISFILENLSGYLNEKPTKKDVLSVFAGLRPLVVPDKEKGTKEISRDHKLVTSTSKLITVTGGKWTTYRRMAEDTVNEAIKVAGLKDKLCRTKDLEIHGFSDSTEQGHLKQYGSDALSISALAAKNPELKEKLHPEFENIYAEVVWAVRNEMAMTVEDVLARRLRILFLDAKAAIEMAPKVAHLMATELGLNKEWEVSQTEKFVSLAQDYLTAPYFLQPDSINKPEKQKTII